MTVSSLKLPYTMVFSVITLILMLSPSVAYACSFLFTISDVVVPWRLSDPDGDCVFEGYTVNWIGVAFLTGITVASVLIVRRLRRKRSNRIQPS